MFGLSPLAAPPVVRAAAVPLLARGENSRLAGGWVTEVVFGEGIKPVTFADFVPDFFSGSSTGAARS